MKFVLDCLAVDPGRRPNTEQLLASSQLFCHDGFSIWFLQDLQAKLQEEFSANPLLRTKKHHPSAGRQKHPSSSSGPPEDFMNKKNSEKSGLGGTGELRRTRRPSESEGLFDEVMKKSLVYSQKYNTSKQTVNRNTENVYKPSFSPEKRKNSSAKSEHISVCLNLNLHLTYIQSAAV